MSLTIIITIIATKNIAIIIIVRIIQILIITITIILTIKMLSSDP